MEELYTSFVDAFFEMKSLRDKLLGITADDEIE